MTREKIQINAKLFPIFCLAILFAGCRPSPPEIVAIIEEEEVEAETPPPAMEEPAAATIRKLKTIVIPRIEFVNTPLEDAVAFLVQRSREVDQDIVVVFAKELDAGRRATQVTLDVTDIPLSEALLYISQLADLKLTLEESAITLSPGTGNPAENALVFVEPEEVEAFRKKLETLIVPVVEFEETPFVDAIGFLLQRARELDVDTPENRRGVDVVLNVPPESGIDVGSLTVTLNFSNVPVGEAFRYTTGAVALQYRVKGTMIVISAPNAP